MALLALMHLVAWTRADPTPGQAGPAVAADPAATQHAGASDSLRPESHLGPIRFAPPSGWLSTDDPGKEAKVLVSPDTTPDKPAAIVILLTKPAPGPFDFLARFKKAVENTAGGQPITDHGEVTADKSRQGCDTLAQTFAFENAAGETVRGQLVAARVGDRLAVFCYLACGDDLYRKHATDMVNLLSSVSFEGIDGAGPTSNPSNPSNPRNTGNAGNMGNAATRPAPELTSRPAPAAPGPATLPEVQAIEREKAELRQRLAELETRERQLAAAFGAEGGRTTGPSRPTPESPSTRPGTEATTEGGSLDLTDRSRPGAWLRSRYPKRTKLVLTLTPLAATGAAPGPARVLTGDVEALPETIHFTGLPAADVKATAKAVTPDGKEWPLKLTTLPTPRLTDWSDSVDVDLRSPPSLGVTDVPK